MAEFKARFGLKDTVWYVNDKTEIVCSVVDGVNFRTDPNGDTVCTYHLADQSFWDGGYLFASRSDLIFHLVGMRE